MFYVIDTRNLLDTRQFGTVAVAEAHITAELEGGQGAADNYLVFRGTDAAEITIDVALIFDVAA